MIIYIFLQIMFYLLYCPFQKYYNLLINMIYIILGSITAQHYDDTYRTTINNLTILIHNLL